MDQVRKQAEKDLPDAIDSCIFCSVRQEVTEDTHKYGSDILDFQFVVQY